MNIKGLPAGLKKDFEDYLVYNLKLSKNSLKFYSSDITHFEKWLIHKIRSWGSYAETLNDTIPHLTQNITKEYKQYLLIAQTPLKTLNRKLSSLRHLARFLQSSQILNFNFMQDIKNEPAGRGTRFSLDPLLNKFKNHLQGQKASKSTVKNYTNDIKHFFKWLEQRTAR